MYVLYPPPPRRQPGVMSGGSTQEESRNTVSDEGSQGSRGKKNVNSVHAQNAFTVAWELPSRGLAFYFHKTTSVLLLCSPGLLPQRPVSARTSTPGTEIHHGPTAEPFLLQMAFGAKRQPHPRAAQVKLHPPFFSISGVLFGFIFLKEKNR